MLVCVSTRSWPQNNRHMLVYRLYMFSSPLRYAVLAPDAARSSKDVKEAGVKVLDELLKTNALKQEEFQCGLTKVSIARSGYARSQLLCSLLFLFDLDE